MENNPIPLKTNSPDYISNDFLQTECGAMEELTVTITLHEYRSLVGECALQKEQLFRYMMERDREKRSREAAEHERDALQVQLDEAVSDGNDLAKENTRLRGEIERQSKIIADLKTRLSDEIRHQNYMKEDAT